MKLERLQESVPATVTVAIGLGLALGTGYSIGNEDFKHFIAIIGTIVVVAFLLLIRQNIWMVIPAFAALGGKVVALPLPFTAAQVAILLAFVMFLAFKALKVVRLKPKFGVEEVWMLIVLFYLLTVYARNPVGTEAMGSERVGGKPYFDAIIACFGYWVLARAVVTEKQAWFIPYLALIGSSASAWLNYLSYRVPALVGPISMIYTGIAAAENNANPWAELQDEGSRLIYLLPLGRAITDAACARYRPFSLLNPLNLRRFLFFMAGIFAILLSGFRSAMMGVFEIFLLSGYFRRGWGEAWRALAILGCILGFLAVAQGRIINLPFPAQRALSFLPGRWEEAAKSEAQGSTEWRWEMWKAMLTEDKYIHNKWLGDGYGFTHYQLQVMEANMLTGTNADQQENLMINGGVHSGPVTAIRYVGFVGLVLYLIFSWVLLRRALQLIRRAKGTPFFPMALVFGLPVLIFPFNFLFIFGSYDEDLPLSIMFLGYLKLLENSLDAYQPTEQKAPEVIQPPKFRPARRFQPVSGAA